MEHQKYQHSKDKTGECANSGFSAEVAFKQLAEEKGYSVKVASREMQYSHVDFVLNKDNKEWMVDVKGAKKIKRTDEKPCFEYAWIEKKNCRGQNGWILGSASQIAFELENEFIIVSRKDLLELVEKLCDFDKLVTQGKKALYCGYRRFGRQDLLTLIKTTDLYQIKHTIWEKGQN